METTQLHISTHFNVTGSIVKISITLKCYCDYSNVIQLSNNSQDIDINVEFRKRLVQQVMETVLNYTNRQGISLNRVSTEFSIEKQMHHSVLTDQNAHGWCARSATLNLKMTRLN